MNDIALLFELPPYIWHGESLPRPLKVTVRMTAEFHDKLDDQDDGFESIQAEMYYKSRDGSDDEFFKIGSGSSEHRTEVMHKSDAEGTEKQYVEYTVKITPDDNPEHVFRHACGYMIMVKTSTARNGTCMKELAKESKLLVVM